MSDVDLRDPGAADVGVTGGYQQANTTSSFVLDFDEIYAKADIDPTIGDVFLIANLVPGFVFTGASIEVVRESLAGGIKNCNVVLGPSTGGTGINVVVNAGTQEDTEGNLYYQGNFTDLPIIADDGNVLKMVNSSQALEGGKIKITVQGRAVVPVPRKRGVNNV